MSTVVIGEREFELIKTGRAQAVQVYRLGVWLKNYGSSVVAVFDRRGEEVQGTAQGLAFIGEILSTLTPDAMLDLFEVILGCDKDFSEENFDIAVLIDSGITIYNEDTSIRRLIDRFFFPASSISEPEDGSTTSE